LFAGAGVIISSGLMRMMTFQEVEEFLTNRSIYQSGGDHDQDHEHELEHEHSMSTARAQHAHEHSMSTARA